MKWDTETHLCSAGWDDVMLWRVTDGEIQLVSLISLEHMMPLVRDRSETAAVIGG